MKYHQDDDISGALNNLNKTPIIVSPQGYKYEFYLTGEVLDADMYIDWFTTIRSATENDLIIIYINSIGGSGATAVQFLSVLEECDAQILMQVEGECYSAATLIFMKAHAFSIAPHSQFMFHNYSGGAIGKGGELEARITHQSVWSKNLLKDCYKHFFTDQEIQQILDGKDFWMEAEEVIMRMEKRTELFKKDYENMVKEAEKLEKEKTKPKVTSKSKVSKEPDKQTTVKHKLKKN